MLADPFLRTAVSLVCEQFQSMSFLIAYLVNRTISEVTALEIHVKEQINFGIFKRHILRSFYYRIPSKLTRNGYK
jgi:hypothetical protein